MMGRTECERCHWRYPSRLLNFLRFHGEGLTRICGICALELSNQLHKRNRETFMVDGEAEELRTAAVSWRSRHPDLAPKEKKHAE